MRVSLFITCLVDQLFPEVGMSALRVLERAGVEVNYDPRQTCCGQPAFNGGYPEESRAVARHFLQTFEGAEAVVIPSGSCASMVRVFLPGLFSRGSAERARAESLAGRTYEFSQFLVDVLGVRSTGARFAHRVTYHDGCHLLRELGVASQPRQLLRSVRDIEFREMEECQSCCGFGGTFSIRFPQLSGALAEEKIERILHSGAEFVVSSDVGCLMHLDGVLRRRRLPVGTLHLAQVLDSFEKEEPAA